MSKETVQSIHIRNFKSVVDLSLELGSFNVLIGENGCGKSNILEAIAFGAAAAADKLDHEFLGSRGVRVTNPEFMYSAFEKKETAEGIHVDYKTINGLLEQYSFTLLNDPNNPKKWLFGSRKIVGNTIGDKLSVLFSKKREEIREEALKKLFPNDIYLIESLKKYTSEVKAIIENVSPDYNNQLIYKFLFDKYVSDQYTNPLLGNFIIYTPEQSSLRKFEETNQIYPLGINGAGLFQYLKDLASNEKNNEVLKSIKDNLTLLDWYENFDLPQTSLSNDFTIHIKDKYLSPDLQYFDQRSTNEGFLYLLFYSTLFLSKDTPAFFAIDNIDASLNPKLCMQLTRNLAELAQKHGKQVIVTTQNPAILDGLNLKDDQQRLFVVRRNDEGHTKATRVEYKAERKMKLSDVWTSGFIGGLPENF